jgi:plasmid stabilization system protein ParE
LTAQGKIAQRLQTAGWIARSVAADLRYGRILSGTIRSPGDARLTGTHRQYAVMRLCGA